MRAWLIDSQLFLKLVKTIRRKYFLPLLFRSEKHPERKIRKDAPIEKRISNLKFSQLSLVSPYRGMTVLHLPDVLERQTDQRDKVYI